MKLFPLLATNFAMAAANAHVLDKYYNLKKEIEHQNFKNLDLLHHYTSGMKAVFTQDVHDGILTVRQSLGGAGYTAWSGLPLIFDDYSPNVTFEGDNTVMAQQCANFLFKQARKALQGKDRTKFDGAFSYLNELKEGKKVTCTVTETHQFLNLDVVEEALKVNLLFKIR
mmetsp:Transcript_5432/g.9156  ORF Transcript_5432/g.9156 Transcript_5432/m.9156 type:complete len:169 (+) Transcript_5432:1089-1595(+)